MLICHPYIFFGKVFKSLAYGGVLFSHYWVLSVLWICWIQIFIRYVICNYFLLVCDSSFIILAVCFKERKFLFWWTAIYWFFFSFTNCACGVLSKKSSLSPSQVSSRTCAVLCLRFMIHLKVNFLYRVWGMEPVSFGGEGEGPVLLCCKSVDHTYSGNYINVGFCCQKTKFNWVHLKI